MVTLMSMPKNDPMSKEVRSNGPLSALETVAVVAGAFKA